RLFEKHIVIGNPTVPPLTRLRQSMYKHRPWGLTQRRMIHLIIDLIGPFTQVGVEIAERPNGKAVRVHLRCDRSWNFARLRIAQQIVEKGTVSRPKEPLNHRSEPWLSGRPNCLLAAMASQ